MVSDLLSARAAPRPAPSADAALPAPRESADGAFFGKGAATADSFRPTYWSYDRETAAPAPPQPGDAKALQEMLKQELEPAIAADAPAATASFSGGNPPAMTADEAIDMQHQAEAGTAEFDAAPSESAAGVMPDDLAQRVLNYRSYAAGRPVNAAPRGGAAAVTADSLMAELASAREARSDDASPRQSPRAGTSARTDASTSLVDRLFALGGVAIVAFGAFLYLSPGHGAAFYGGRSIGRLVSTL